MPPEQQPHFSFSQLYTYSKCGEMYRRKYIDVDDAPTMPSVPMVVGSAVHSAMESYEHLSYSPRLNQMVELAKDFINAELEGRGLEDEELMVTAGRDLKWYRTTGLEKMLAGFLKMREDDLMLRHQTVAYIDREPAVELDVTTDYGEFEMAGHVDAIMLDMNNNYIIRDYKTGPAHDSHRVQLELYRMLLERKYGIKSAYGQIAYTPASGKHTIKVVRWSYPDEALDAMIWGLKDARDTRIMPPTGPLVGSCDYCDFASVCEFGKPSPIGIG